MVNDEKVSITTGNLNFLSSILLLSHISPTMALSDMDAWAVKTVVLLNSKADDSADQLRLLLEESIRQKYGSRRQFRPIPNPLPSTKRVPPLVVDEVQSKKIKLESKFKVNPCELSTIIESDSSISDDSDLAMEILENDLACAVCRGMGVVAKNRLVECAECHALYHQECHIPNISDMDVSDPRLVWYCSNCNKSVTKPKSSISGISSNGKHPYNKSGSSHKTNHTSSSYSSKPFGGLSLPGKKSSNGSQSKSSSSSSSKTITPNINIISADKRLQIMKKKAAKKQEKRILPK